MATDSRPKVMKALLSLRMIGRLLALGLLASSVSCTTTYDHTGRPVQSVDPGAAAVGVVAAGIIGYALASDHDNKHHGNRYHHGYHHGYSGHHGYGDRGYHCR